MCRCGWVVRVFSGYTFTECKSFAGSAFPTFAWWSRSTRPGRLAVAKRCNTIRVHIRPGYGKSRSSRKWYGVSLCCVQRKRFDVITIAGYDEISSTCSRFKHQAWVSIGFYQPFGTFAGKGWAQGVSLLNYDFGLGIRSLIRWSISIGDDIYHGDYCRHKLFPWPRFVAGV